MCLSHCLNSQNPNGHTTTAGIFIHFLSSWLQLKTLQKTRHALGCFPLSQDKWFKNNFYFLIDLWIHTPAPIEPWPHLNERDMIFIPNSSVSFKIKLIFIIIFIKLLWMDFWNSCLWLVIKHSPFISIKLNKHIIFQKTFTVILQIPVSSCAWAL